MKELIVKKIITILNILFGFSLIPWFLVLPFIMLFIGPISKDSLYLYFIALDYMIYPIIVIISIILSRKYNLLWLSLLSLINIIIFLFLFVFI